MFTHGSSKKKDHGRERTVAGKTMRISYRVKGALHESRTNSTAVRICVV